MTEETAAPEASGAEAVSAPSSSSGEAISRALDSVFGDAQDTSDIRKEDAPAPDEKPASGPQRGPDGKFAAKEATPPDAGTEATDPAKPEDDAEKAEAKDEAKETGPDAPRGFDPAAKAAWEAAPAELKGAVSRRIGELESGLRQYQQDFGDLRPFVQMAKQANIQPKAAIEAWMSAERILSENPVEGVRHLAKTMGFDAKAVLAQIAGDAPPDQKDGTIEALRREIADLKRGFGGVQQTMQQQREASIQRDVEAFAASNPRFEELSGDIAEMLRTGYAKDLADAYAKAERLNPLPPSPQPAARNPEQQAAQTRKASLAVTGAPVAGSNPATRKTPSSTKEALEGAFSSLGL